MHRMRVFLFALLLAASAFAQDARVRAFEQFAEEAMKAQQMPGLSVAVMHGDFRWSRGFGFADVENEVPARADSSYRMASVTKPMTAVGVLKLVDEGKIDLDAEVQTYVPYFPRKAQKITIRQLLAHQGGISHYRDYEKEGHIREPKSTREAIAIFADFDLVAEPGTAYRYSSYGYNLLGAAIETASGKSYGEYMAENVWKPLGMAATRMDDPRAMIPHRVTGYVLEDGKLRRSEYVDVSSRFGGGGTRSTVEDMIRFVEGLANGKVLKAETRELAWTAQPTRDRRYTNYGLGFGSVTFGGRWGIEHSGAQQETRTNVLYLPREKFAIALASNFENADLGVFQDKLMEIFLQQPREIGARTNDDAETNMLRAMQQAYAYGFAYYDRYGKAMTTDAAELTKAFRYFNDALKDKKLVDDGRHPVAGEPLTKVGSYIASVLAANGDMNVYHREGALRFFADYARAAKAYRLDPALASRVAKWSSDWARVWTPELASIDVSTPKGLEAFERHRDELIEASIKPDFSGDLVNAAEAAVMKGDVGTALRIAGMGYMIYPRSAGMNGVLGILALLNNDSERGRALLTTSVEIDPKGYANANNLLKIADFLAKDERTKPVSIALLQIATDLHPAEARLKTRLEELQK
jgi:CubicO group peptidase (beta-lactamase class C family)